MKEIKILNWELPENVDSSAIIPLKEITLISRTIGYDQYDRKFQLHNYSKVKNMVALEMAHKILDNMEYEVVEEFAGKYIHRFITRCLIEKEKFKYMTEISELKSEIEDFKMKLSGKDFRIKSLDNELNRIKNFNFWNRVKFLFKSKGEM